MPARKRPAAKRRRNTTTERGLTPDHVKAELLAVWDADSWLTLQMLEARYEADQTLNDAGITPLEAEGYVNKYNSIITRFQLNPKLVKPSEARAWVAKAMKWVVKTVHERATA